MLVYDHVHHISTLHDNFRSASTDIKPRRNPNLPRLRLRGKKQRQNYPSLAKALKDEGVGGRECPGPIRVLLVYSRLDKG